MRLGPQVQLLRSGDREERRLEKTGTKLQGTSPSGRTEGSPVPRRMDEASHIKDNIPRKKRTLLCGWRERIYFLKWRRTKRGHVQLRVPDTWQAIEVCYPAIAAVLTTHIMPKCLFTC